MKVPFRSLNSFQDLFEIAKRSESTVLLSGPTGSGKTSLARRIHQSGARRDRPFVTINLASVHSGTIESELFGHERGAFTGADQRRIGKLESANGGTVFLDEIGEIPPTLQAKLLEFLQSKTISPVGSNREIRLNVRVIVATHKDLARAVARGEFRADLFHRLRVIQLKLSALAERSEEFGDIVHQMLEDLCAESGRTVLRISGAVAEQLERYEWPGNFRELRNVLEFAVAASRGEEILPASLPPWFGECVNFPSAPTALGVAEEAFQLPYAESMMRFEREFLIRSLRKYRGRINHTARQIGMNKATLIRRMRAFGLTSDGVFAASETNPIPG